MQALSLDRPIPLLCPRALFGPQAHLPIATPQHVRYSGADADVIQRQITRLTRLGTRRPQEETRAQAWRRQQLAGRVVAPPRSLGRQRFDAQAGQWGTEPARPGRCSGTQAVCQRWRLRQRHAEVGGELAHGESAKHFSLDAFGRTGQDEAKVFPHPRQHNSLSPFATHAPVVPTPLLVSPRLPARPAIQSHAA
eukprot:668276-Pleurochrysis_carterae.AAC.3